MSLNINIGILMKNPEISRSFSDHLKTNKMCKHAVKKLPHLLGYVQNQYKT